MKNERKEELKDEMKNRISLALKDPILQQGFEIICKENAELKEQVTRAFEVLKGKRKRIEELERKLEQTEKDLADYQFNYPTIKELEKENAELKEELKAIDKAGEHVRQQINDAFRNKKPYWELEKENTELKGLLKWWVSHCGNHDLHYAKRTEQFLKE